jgi:hypothetical protein
MQAPVHGKLSAACRRIACVLALAALVLNQSLLPILPGRNPAASSPALTDTAFHGAGLHHRIGDRPQDNSGQDDAAHQTCHFCRLAGIALPPPPQALPVRPSRAGTPVLDLTNRAIRPEEHFRIGRLVRAPPRIV